MSENAGSVLLNSGDIQKPSEISVHIVNFTEITPEAVQQLDTFLVTERNLTAQAAQSAGQTEEIIKRREGDVAMAFGLSCVSRRKNQGYLYQAIKANTLVGFGVVNYYPEHEDPGRVDVYFGRAWNEKGHGIATNILRNQIETIRSLGVTTFIARPTGIDSENVYRRLGIPLDPIPVTPLSPQQQYLVKI